MHPSIHPPLMVQRFPSSVLPTDFSHICKCKDVIPFHSEFILPFPSLVIQSFVSSRLPELPVGPTERSALHNVAVTSPRYVKQSSLFLLHPAPDASGSRLHCLCCIIFGLGMQC